MPHWNIEKMSLFFRRCRVGFPPNLSAKFTQAVVGVVISIGMLTYGLTIQAQQLLPSKSIPTRAPQRTYLLVSAPENFTNTSPIRKPELESTFEPALESTFEPALEPELEPALEPVPEMKFGDSSQYMTSAPENLSKELPATEPLSEPSPEPSPELSPEPSPELSPEPSPEPSPPLMETTSPAMKSNTPGGCTDSYCGDVRGTHLGGCGQQNPIVFESAYRGCGTGSSCGCDQCDPCRSSDPDQPWRLFQARPFGIQTYGWVETGTMFNPSNPASGYNGPIALNDFDSDLMLNQLYLIMERPVEKGIYGWDLGGRIDFLYGSDARVLKTRGWELRPDGSDRWNVPGRVHQFSIPQLYAEIAHRNLSMKLGHFYSPVGYETPAAPHKFFYTQSYAFTNAGPFTHFGGLLSWKASERFTFHGGIVNGWNALDREDDRAAFIGGVNFKPWHKRFSIAYSFISGTEPDRLGDVSACTKHTLAFAWDINKQWQYVLAHSAGWQDNVLGQQAEWYGIANYLFYQINPCWKAGMRAEWFRDDDGVQIAGYDANNPYLGGSPGNFWELSLGMNWTPNSNFMLRPELRWDWYDGEGNLPFDDGTKSNQFLAGMDMVVQF